MELEKDFRALLREQHEALYEERVRRGSTIPGASPVIKIRALFRGGQWVDTLASPSKERGTPGVR